MKHQLNEKNGKGNSPKARNKVTHNNKKTAHTLAQREREKKRADKQAPEQHHSTKKEKKNERKKKRIYST